MSYRGRPSKGCEVCRARKVKCDETKPICTRCSRSGSECKYRDPADLLFKNQTESAAQRAEDNWRKRSKSLSRARSDSIVQSSGEPSSRSSPARQRARSVVSRATRHSPLTSSSKGKQIQLPPIDDASNSKAGSLLATPSLGPDLHQIAYDRFIYDFVSPETPNRPPDEPSDAMFTFIPILYHNASPDSCLAKIVDAVAYINLANKCNMPQAALLGESSMGEGLKWLSRTISDSEQAASNDALCSSHLLTIYENLTSTNCRETFKAHQNGANALLQLRTVEEYFSSPISAQLYELIFWQQMVGSLNAGKAPPVPIQNILIGRRNLVGPYNESNTSVIEIIWKEADFHARWLELKKSANPAESRRDLQDLLRIGLELDTEFQNWQANMPMNWRHRVSPNTAEERSVYDIVWQKLMLESIGAPNEIFSFTNLQRCWVWGFYRTSRMFLLRDILEILNWMLRFPDPSPTSTHFHMPITQDAMNYPRPQMQLQHDLSTASLQLHHTTTTRHLVTTIEQTCSAILGSFTVPIPSKSSGSTSVVTMRGYVVLWAMGTMDSILSSGLVPDSSSTMPLSPPSTNCSSPHTYTPMYITHASLAPACDPSRDPSLDPGLVYHDASSIVQENYPSFEHAQDMHAEAHRSSHMPLGSESQAAMRQVPLWDHKARKGHVFDSCPKHPYDHPVDVPAFSSDGVPRGSIDVTARRLWLNRMLYYIGTELGIKKALAVPMLEGYWDVVKAEVADILGR